MNDEWRGREAGFFHSFFWRCTLIVEKLTPHPRYAPGKTSSGVLPSRAIKIEKIKNATGVDACTRISPILPIITLAVSSAASRYGNAMLDPATNARIAHYKSSFYRCNQSLSFWWIDVEEQEYILCFSFFLFIYLFFLIVFRRKCYSKNVYIFFARKNREYPLITKLRRYYYDREK